MSVKILIILLLFGVQLYSGQDIAKIEFDNGKEVYEIRELQNKSVEFLNPKKDMPTLREIIFYKVIEKPYIQETYDQMPIIGKSKDEQERQEPVFDETRRPFTNSHGLQFSNWGDQDENTHIVENKNKDINNNKIAENNEHKDDDEDNDDKYDSDRDKNGNDNDKFDDNYSNDNDNDKNGKTHYKNDDMFEDDDDTEDNNKKQLNSSNENIKNDDNDTDDEQNRNNTNPNEENNDKVTDNIGKTNITKEDVTEKISKEDKLPEEQINLAKKLRDQLLNSTKEKYHTVQRIHVTEKKERRKREVSYRNIPEAPRLPDLDVKSFPSYIQRMLANRNIFGNDEKSKTKNDYHSNLFDKMSGIFPPDNIASDKTKTYGFKYNQGRSNSWNNIHKSQIPHESNGPNVLDLSGSQTNNPYEVQEPRIDIRDNVAPEQDVRLSKNKEESPKNIMPSLDIDSVEEKDHFVMKKNTESEKQSNTDFNDKEKVYTNHIDNDFSIKDRLVNMLHSIDNKLSNGKKPKTYGMSLKGDKGEIWNDIVAVPSINIDNTHNKNVLDNESINNPNKISNFDYEKEDNVNDNKDYHERNPNTFESDNGPNKVSNFDDAKEVIDSFNDNNNKKGSDNYGKINSGQQGATHGVNNAEMPEENRFDMLPPTPTLPDFKLNDKFITSTNKPKVNYKQIHEIVQHTTGIPNVSYFTQRSTEKSIEATEEPKLEEPNIEKEHQPINNEGLRRKMEESFDNIIKQFPKLEPMKEEKTDVDVSKKNDARNNNNEPRTYGMRLEGDHGYVWNDLTNPRTHTNVGDLENTQVTEPSVDEVTHNSNIEEINPVENHSESPIQTTPMEIEKTEITTHKNEKVVTKETTTTTTERNNVEKKKSEEENNGTTEKSKDIELDDKKDCTCKNDTLNKDKTESGKKNNGTESIKVTLDDLLKKDEFWQWLSNWTTTYMEVLNERIEKLVEERVAKRLEKNANDNHDDEVDTENKNSKNDDNIKINKKTDDNKDIDEHKSNNNHSKINNDDIQKSNKTDIEPEKDVKNNKKTEATTEKSDQEPIPKDDVNSTDNDMSKKRNITLPFNIKADTIYGNAIDSDHITNIFIFYPNVKLNKTDDQLEPLINKTNSGVFDIGKPENLTFDERIGIPDDDKDNQIKKPNTSTEISSSTQSNTETITEITSTTASPTTTEELAKSTPKGIEDSKNENNSKPLNNQITLKEPEKVTEKVLNDNQITSETSKSNHDEKTTDATNAKNIKETTKLSDQEVTTELPKTVNDNKTTKPKDKETTTESNKTESDKEMTTHDEKETAKETDKGTTKPDDDKTATSSDNNETTTDKSETTTESSKDKPSDSSDVTSTEKSTGS